MADDNFIPRKSWPTISPSFIRNKLITSGLDEKIAGPITDTFSSIFAKFAVDERLNYDVIERALRGLDGGIATRFATLVIAAVDSDPNGILGADYKCDGTSDDVIIQQALDELATYPMAYGHLIFLHGNYDIDAPLVLKSDCWLDGSSYVESMGDGVQLNAGSATTVIDCDGFSAKITNLGFTSGSNGDTAINIAGSIGTHIEGNFFHNYGQAIFAEDIGGTDIIYDTKIINNVFRGCGASGKSIVDFSTVNNGTTVFHMLGNTFRDSDTNDNNFLLDNTGAGGEGPIIANNHFEGNVSINLGFQFAITGNVGLNNLNLTNCEQGTITGNNGGNDLNVTDCDKVAIAGNQFDAYVETTSTNIVKAGNVGTGF